MATPDLVLIIIIAVHFMLTAVVIYNYFTAPVVEVYGSSQSVLNISVLIPARNEEKNLGRCLDSVLKQDYNNYEVIVLDDNSNDNTAKIAGSFAEKDNRLRVIKGSPLPQGWLGKNFACYQLSSKARYSHLLFLDADVILSENALKAAASLYIQKKAGMLTIFPTQIINNNAAWLVVPLMNWLLLTFLPLKKVYSSPNRKYIAANGQFILINKKIYESAGGHAEIKNEIVEDMELAKKVKQRGFTVVTAPGSNKVYCNMYGSFMDSISGFAKNFYPGFKVSRLLFFILLILMLVLFFIPCFAVFYNPAYLIPVALIIIQRIFISKLSAQPVLINVLLHPLQMMVLTITGIFSAVIAGRHRLTWKGRKI